MSSGRSQKLFNKDRRRHQRPSLRQRCSLPPNGRCFRMLHVPPSSASNSTVFSSLHYTYLTCLFWSVFLVSSQNPLHSSPMPRILFLPHTFSAVFICAQLHKCPPYSKGKPCGTETSSASASFLHLILFLTVANQ